MNFPLRQIIFGVKIDEGYKGRTPGLYGEVEKCIKGFSGDT